MRGSFALLRMTAKNKIVLLTPLEVNGSRERPGGSRDWKEGQATADFMRSNNKVTDLGVYGVAASGGGFVSGDGGGGGAVELGAEVLVGGAGEVGAEVFFGLAGGEVAAEQALDGGGGVFGGGAVAEGARRTGVLADGSADAEVEGVLELAVNLELLAFEADVGDPVLAAGVGAAGDVELDLLVEAGESAFHFFDEPLAKPLVSAMASLQNSVPVQAMAPRQKGETSTTRSMALRSAMSWLNILVADVDEDDVLHDGGAELPLPCWSARSARASGAGRRRGGRGGRRRRRRRGRAAFGWGVMPMWSR